MIIKLEPVNDDIREAVLALSVREDQPFVATNAVSLRQADETNAGDWNVDFFRKNGYLLRGELKDVPKGHNCYELYKMI